MIIYLQLMLSRHHGKINIVINFLLLVWLVERLNKWCGWQVGRIELIALIWLTQDWCGSQRWCIKYANNHTSYQAKSYNGQFNFTKTHSKELTIWCFCAVGVKILPAENFQKTLLTSFSSHEKVNRTTIQGLFQQMDEWYLC